MNIYINWVLIFEPGHDLLNSKGVFIFCLVYIIATPWKKPTMAKTAKRMLTLSRKKITKY